MRRRSGWLLATAVLEGCLSLNSSASTQTAPGDNATPALTPDNAMMITVFLKHDQSRPLSELNAQLEKQGYQGVSATRRRSGELVYRDGDRTGRHLAASGFTAARGQPCAGGHGLGSLSHRILSDLRLQGDRDGAARKVAVEDR